MRTRGLFFKAPRWTSGRASMAALGVIAALTAVNAGTTRPGMAQVAGVPCAPRKIIVEQLAKTHKESRTALGQVGDKRIMEIFVAPSGGWTLLLTRVDGFSCIVGSGSNWQQWKVARGDPA